MKLTPAPMFHTSLALIVTASAGLACGQRTDISDWYPYQPSAQTIAGTPLDMSGWNENVAGENGWIEMQGDKLVLDGEPIKLWGTNLTYDFTAPSRELADKQARFYAALGMNSVRLHKYADGGSWAGIMSDNSILEFVPEELDRMDYFVAALKHRGIYTKLSPNFGIKLQPGDRKRVPWFDEIDRKREERVDAGNGAIYLSDELQAFQLETLVNILEHVNPYTGKRYADDPAIWCVEFFNEDSVLFGGTNRRLQDTPTLRRRTAERFSRWLLDKYGSDEAWRQAWGEDIIYGDDGIEGINEHLANLIEMDRVKGELEPELPSAGTVVPWGRDWFFDNSRDGGHVEVLQPRMVDAMSFLITLQDAFHEKLTQAVRDTGYKGVLMGSNWQAGNNVPHFHNLYSDAKVGIVDRHNYVTGPRRAARDSNVQVSQAAMVADPGSDMLSSGLQQVADRPFMLSEWIHEQPHEYYLEGPAILGVYGMGLNGWDVSYIFQNRDNGEFTNRIGRDTWDVMTPMIAGTFPAVSRIVRRMDVEEGPLVAAIKVHPESLHEGVATGTTVIRQRGDVKSFDSDEAPNDAMAVGRVAVKFTQQAESPEPFDPSEHMSDGALHSVTDQLRWTPAPEGEATAGYFTIDTPATVGFVGFAEPSASFALGGFTIAPKPGFGAVYLTSVEPDSNLDDGDVLLVAMARGRNADSKYNDDDSRILELGKGPLVLEPVRADITLPDGRWRVEKLNHDGRPTGRFLDVNDGVVTIDGSQDKTPYYLLHRQ
jgi:hypothetical protein